MHIPDGILSGQVIGGGWALSAAGIAIGFRRIKADDMPKTACVASAFFVAGLIHMPVGMSSAHLVLNGLAGALLGWAAFPAIAIALTLQALLFQFGGFQSLGVNIFDMALPVAACGTLFRFAIRKAQSQWTGFTAGFLTGFIAVGISCLLAASALSLSSRSFETAAKLLLAAHLPVMLAEGFATGFAVLFLKRIKPELFIRETPQNES